MKKIIRNVEIIGFGLAVLYAVSCLAFVKYLNIPELKIRTGIYVILFGSLCVGAIGVMTLNEWGRKLLIVINIAMLGFLALRFLPEIDLAPLAYLFLSIIVILYFTQQKVKRQFHMGRYDAWNRSILVIDDDESIGKIVRPILFSHGYSVLTAETGEEGIQVAKKQKPDLILLDVILPGIKGREVCKVLKEDPETANIPIVFQTAKNSPEDVKAENEVGSSGHITKPIDPRILIGTIQGILDPGGG